MPSLSLYAIRNCRETESEQTLRSLFHDHGQIIEYSIESSVFREGDKYRGIFLVLSGSLKWFKTDSEGNEAVLKIYSAGEIAGLPPLFDTSPDKAYIATLTALQNSRVAYWAENKFHTFIEYNPRSLVLFSEQMCSTLRDLVEHSSAMSLKSVPARLCDYLSSIGAASRWVALPLKKHQLASALNTCPETLSRAFKSLRMDGQIDIHDGEYRLLPTFSQRENLGLRA